MDRYGTGLKGELAARDYLVKKGYRIVATNVNYPAVGELDIVALDGQTLVFVEVRTRFDNSFGHPFETMTKGKINKVVRASRRYIAEFSPRCTAFRYDAIAVLNDNIEHIESAFYAN